MKILVVIKYVFSIIGLAMLAGGFMFYQSTSQFLSESHAVQGRIVDHEARRSDGGTVYKSVVEFSGEDGRAHRILSSVASKPPAHELDERVEVLYPRGNPQAARLNSFFELWSAATFLLALGAVFFGVGTAMMLVGHFKRRKGESLKANGLPVAAEFLDVEYNRALSVNGQHPFVIVCHWLHPETQQRHLFKSENIWFDPAGFITGKTVEVYIEPGNPKKYYVDISFLPR